MRQQRFDEAIEVLDKQVTDNPTDAVGRVCWRESHSRRRATLINLLASSMRRRSWTRTSSRLATRVLLLNSADRKPEAIKLLNAEVERRKDFTAYLLRGEWFAAEKRAEEAEKDFQRLTTFEKSAVEGWQRLASFFTSRRNARIRRWSRTRAASNWMRENRTLKCSLCHALLASSTPEARQRGQQLLTELLASKPDDMLTKMVQAEDLLRSDQMPARQKAMAIYAEVVKAEPHNIEAHFVYRVFQCAA